MNKSPICIKLSLEERIILQDMAGKQTAAHRDVIRAKTILLLVDDNNVSSVARQVGLQRRIVRKGAERFTKKRLKGLLDEPRSGRPARFSPLCHHRPEQARL